ncbi:MAG TPA: HypC/HybG/HupF family hydrogenase formation chaperone [Candidatus Sabulitectum sp.]|nr:HypC/HybG/HupF family hydrogenase formation chaperone [Candidatus Sabulitectum sp.]
MCLAVPMRIKEMGEGGTGVCELEGVTCQVDLSLVEDPGVDDFVLVHAGFAIEKLDREEADSRLRLFQELAEMRGKIPSDQ